MKTKQVLFLLLALLTLGFFNPSIAQSPKSPKGNLHYFVEYRHNISVRIHTDQQLTNERITAYPKAGLFYKGNSSSASLIRTLSEIVGLRYIFLDRYKISMGSDQRFSSEQWTRIIDQTIQAVEVSTQQKVIGMTPESSGVLCIQHKTTQSTDPLDQLWFIKSNSYSITCEPNPNQVSLEFNLDSNQFGNEMILFKSAKKLSDTDGIVKTSVVGRTIRLSKGEAFYWEQLGPEVVKILSSTFGYNKLRRLGSSQQEFVYLEYKPSTFLKNAFSLYTPPTLRMKRTERFVKSNLMPIDKRVL